MNRLAGAFLAVAALAATGSPGPAWADNPLGFYVGAGLGESTVRSDRSNEYGPYGGGYGYGYGYGGYFNDSDHHFAWKAIAGIRPISLVGAELEYIDFGHPGSDDNYYYNDNYYYGPDSHPRAIVAFGVGHLPLPLPYIDIYGKLGAARLHTNVNGFDGGNCAQNCADGGVNISRSVWDTRFAYGMGIQSTFWGLSVRAEYERISSPFGDPDIFSVGATWTF